MATHSVAVWNATQCQEAGADPDGDGRIGPTSLDRRQRPRIAEQLIHAREILGQLAHLHRGASSNNGSTC
jgi:hypothetical protein